MHLVIDLPSLDEKARRRIWSGFFDKLQEDKKGQIKIMVSARKYVQESEEVLDIKLNGREIRNAFQTAIALADSDARSDEFSKPEDPIIVAKEHFEQLFAMYGVFREYYNSIQTDTPERSARVVYGRNDQVAELSALVTRSRSQLRSDCP